MAKKEHRYITQTELNAIVYRYLLDSGFTHSGFNFVHEAGLEKIDIQGMNIPPGALVRVVHKGLQYMELEANSEVENDDDYHLFDTLDLITNDTDELKRKIVRNMKLNSFENDKEQKTNSFKTDKGQKVSSSEHTRTRRSQPMRHERAKDIVIKEQNINAAETAQNTAQTATGQKRKFERTGTKLKLKKQKQ